MYELLVDSGENNVNVTGVLSWVIGVVIGFLFTNIGFFSGPFAEGIFKDNSLGLLLAFFVSLISFTILRFFLKRG